MHEYLQENRCFEIPCCAMNIDVQKVPLKLSVFRQCNIGFFQKKS